MSMESNQKSQEASKLKQHQGTAKESWSLFVGSNKVMAGTFEELMKHIQTNGALGFKLLREGNRKNV